jgi:hypothetical protein
MARDRQGFKDRQRFSLTVVLFGESERAPKTGSRRPCFENEFGRAAEALM